MGSLDVAAADQSRERILATGVPAVWSPDGTRIAYSAGRLGDTIYEKAASGVGDGQVLLTEP